MTKSLRPGIAIAIFLNVALLLGIPFFGEGEASRLAPVILLALAMPWILAWAVGRIVNGVREDPPRERDSEDPPDFV